MSAAKQELQRQLAADGLTQDDLEKHLLWQLTLVRFIDLRFRPAIQVTAKDVQDYFGPGDRSPSRSPGEPAPPGRCARRDPGDALGQRADQQLDEWLKHAKTTTRIDYKKEAFQVSRPVRISLITIASLLVLALIVVIGGISVLRSDWFFQQVRDRVVAEMEKSTGGKVELRQFHLDWQHADRGSRRAGDPRYGTAGRSAAAARREGDHRAEADFARQTAGGRLIRRYRRAAGESAARGRRQHQYSRTQDAAFRQRHRPDDSRSGGRPLRRGERNRCRSRPRACLPRSCRGTCAARSSRLT